MTIIIGDWNKISTSLNKKIILLLYSFNKINIIIIRLIVPSLKIRRKKSYKFQTFMTMPTNNPSYMKKLFFFKFWILLYRNPSKLFDMSELTMRA